MPRTHIPRRALASLALAWGAAPGTAAAQNTFCVAPVQPPAGAACPCPPGSFYLPEICQAIQFASDGDTIAVHPGTYLPFDLGTKKLVIERACPTDPSPVVVDGSLDPTGVGCAPTGGRCAIIQGGQGPETVLDGLELVNGNPNGMLLGSDGGALYVCLLYTSPSPRDQRGSRMPSSA